MRMRNKYEVLLFLLILVVTISDSIGALCGDHDKGEGFQNPADGVCSNVDIRITMDQFKRLQNCTVVEGSLHISLIERAVHEDYEKWSFPELREITGNLRLYRVYGLKTLRHLFPNLTVIGGRHLFSNYALVAYEMPDLEELGLVSLRTISRGGVRITKSKKLCYVDTVDWGRLGVDAGAQDFKDNKEESQCANYCPENCPTTKEGNVDTKRCWTSEHCQLGLNCRCKVNQTCMDNGTCCHDYCVGGCVGTGPADCYSCKGVTYKGRCLTKCPASTFMFSDRRCLTDKECLALVNNTEDIGKNTKILRGEKGEPSICVTECPQHYTIRDSGEGKNLECVKCQGFCPKVCNSTEVNSIQDAEKLKDCSKIIGPLIIQIMSGSNVAQEMEKNLGSIKEVTGFISIRRSYALLTLYFLKSLEIFGDSPLHQKNSLIVMDNSNLQELFPEEQMKKMKFKHGKVSFHGNRKLCLYKINNFVKYLNLSEAPSEQDISRATNGDLIPCIEQHLNLNVTDIYHNSVVLKWTKDTSDTRHLLTYIINYKEIKDKSDINIYLGRDACSIDAWMTNEQPPADDSNPFQLFALTNLKAYTTYAVYVQAYTLPTATHAAITNVETFTTNPYYPSEPLDLEVSSEDSHELIVKWKPPKFPNGHVTHYKVIYQKQVLDASSFEQRDYCREPNSSPKEASKEKEEAAEKKQNVTANCCVCPKTKEELEAEARKQEIEIYFENYLHDQVYCQRYEILPVEIKWTEIKCAQNWSDLVNIERVADCRNITSRVSDVQKPATANISVVKNMTEVNESYKNLTSAVHEIIVKNATKVILPNLEHFQEYNIEVQACHDTNNNKHVGIKLCSNRAMTAGRTKPLRIMDSLNESSINVKIVVNITTDVFITWDPPSNPNSLILTYNIFYKRANQDNLVAQQICVNNKDFQKHSGYHLTGLDRGNWTFQINAISLAGNGSLTQEKYFILPYPPDDDYTYNVIHIVAIIVVLTIVIVVLSMFLFVKLRFRSSVLTVISPNINYVPSDQMYTMDDWEVDRDKIKLIRELGQGSFGMVYEGVAKGLGDDPEEETRVAVKTVNDRASFNDRREFLKEATTMKAFDCFHVVKLLGVVSTGQPALVIMELMTLGDLKNYLREHRPDENDRPGVSPPKLLDILQMAGEIADGMAYLADKKFVHRDLAARNCMVADDKVVKIGDFGMTRDIYETDYYRKGGKGMLPVRWMAPESLKDGVFTSMSDVWSYGVVMWEMVTLAAQPYQGLSNEEVVKYISEDSTMDIPNGCPEKMAYLMQRCWAKKPKNRPTFKDIIEYLLPQLSSRFQKVSYFFNDGGGPMKGEENRVRGLGQLDEDEDAGSSNSLNCEGAAAPKLFLNKGNGNYSLDGSPHPSGGSFSLYDDGIDPDRYIKQDENVSHFLPDRRDLNVNKDFEDVDSSNSHSEYTTSDSHRPFLLDDFQTVPSVNAWQPSMSPECNGNDSVLTNSGHVELQPLITKDCSPSPPSPRINSAQSPNTELSEYVTHQPRTGTVKNPNTVADPQKLQQHDSINHAIVDAVRSGPPIGTAPLSVQQSSSVKSPVVAQPSLVLPTLNQPPSGGFRRAPLYKPIPSSRNSQSSSNSHNFSQSPSAASKTSLVNSDEEIRPPQSIHHNLSSSDTLTNTSDASNNSTKYSFINGQTNGHIPVPTLRQRTAPC